MNKDSARHSLFLLFSLSLVFFWINNKNLANFSLQLTAGLVIFLVITHKIFEVKSFLLTESLVSTICVALITTATGGLSSPFFFLNHFLLFELSLLLAPSISIVLTLSLMIFYLFSNQVGPSFNNLVILLSFLFITPMAFLTGKIYQKVKNQRKEIKYLSRKVENLEYEINGASI